MLGDLLPHSEFGMSGKKKLKPSRRNNLRIKRIHTHIGSGSDPLREVLDSLRNESKPEKINFVFIDKKQDAKDLSQKDLYYSFRLVKFAESFDVLHLSRLKIAFLSRCGRSCS